MSKARTVALGAVILLGLAGAAEAQGTVKADSVKEDAPIRRPDRVDGMRRRSIEHRMDRIDRRGMRGPMRRGMRQGDMRRGMRPGAIGRGSGPRMGGELGAQLQLTEEQRTRIRAIHEKYMPEFRALREQQVAQMQALRGTGAQRDTSAAARERFRQQREQFRQRAQAIQLRERAEIRNVLTAEQRAKVDAAREAQAKRLEERATEMQERARELRRRD